MVIKDQYGDIICHLEQNELGYWVIPDGDYPFPCAFDEGDVFTVCKED